MWQVTMAHGWTPAVHHTETSVSSHIKKTRTFGGHMVSEIFTQFQTIWWIALTPLLNSLTQREQRPLESLLEKASVPMNVRSFLLGVLNKSMNYNETLSFLWGTDSLTKSPPFGDFKWFVGLVWGDFLVKEYILIFFWSFMFRMGLVKRSNQALMSALLKRGSFVYNVWFFCLLNLSLFDFEEINNAKIMC